ncbi:DUF2975 domain-containing protein [Hyphococcus flavus]|uniref:DUF2975 domain-containing protein n=1 Tax=Hyphococcus flavus TaxID=1866326 RepID=A0AAF0CC54_9PROT|nr:DUF2975 domain-containing protein [Hyphococcus flavus]WDI32620.1 DUF2975 domain-containing protein [Hyphococcus flavus]
MRAIGKGSLASILAVGLHVTRIILWVVLFGVTIAMIAFPFVPFVADIFTDSDNVSINGGFEIGEYFEVTHAFVNTGVMLFVVNRLLEILKTLRFGSPFVKENADRFRTVGYALLIGEGAKFAFGFLSLIFDTEVDIDMSFLTWLAIIAVLVLSEVFREGARMKDEQDLTV